MTFDPTPSPTEAPLPAESYPIRDVQLMLAPVRAVYALIGLNVLAFLPYLGTLFNLETVWYLTLALGGLLPFTVLDYQQLWRLITTAFLHSDPAHIALNMYALYILGRNAERLFGLARFTVGYMLALLSGSILVLALAERNSITIGASGAIMGLAGMLLVYSYRYREFPAVRVMFGSMLRMALLNLGLGLLPGISLWGHLGGFLGGLAAGWALCPSYLGTDDGWMIRLTPESWSNRESGRLAAVSLGLVALLVLILQVR